MKSDVKKNLWEIVKYLLTLGVSAIVKLVQRKRAKKLSSEYTPEQVEFSKRVQKQLDRVSDLATRPVNDQIAEAMYDQGHLDPKP